MAISSVMAPGLGAAVRRFACEEDGSATIWCLLWLLLFVGIAGLAIDSTNGFRNKTMLQSTADVAALAGAIDLPNPDRAVAYDPDGYDDVKNAAIGFAHMNMGMKAEHFGSYLVDDGDGIQIGRWDFEANHHQAWTPGDATDPEDAPVNAVRVNLYQITERGNGVATTLLRVAGFTDWDIQTTAIAALGYNHCYDQGFMSRKKVCQRTNSHWYPGFCLYGEEGIFLRPNNSWSEGSWAMLPDGAHDGVDQSNKDAGLSVDRVAAPLEIPMVDSIPAIATELLSGDTFYAHPGFLEGAPVYKLETTTISGNAELTDIGGWSGVQVADLGGFASVASLLGLGSSHKAHPGQGGGPPGGNPPGGGGGGGGGGDGGDAGGGGGGAGGCQGGSSGGSEVAPLPADWQPGVDVENLPGHSDPVLEKNRIYYYDGNGTITIDGTLQDVVIVTHGKVRLSNGAALEGVTVVSLDDSAEGSDAISMSHARLGKVDPCEPGGEVRVYAMGSMGGAAGAEFYGATLAAGGSIGFAAQGDAMYGITAYAAGNISFTSNNTFGGQEDRGITDSGACSDATATPIPDEVWEAVLVH